MTPDVKQLIEEIERAFWRVTREDGVTLHEADIIAYYGTREQATAARRLDTEGHWRDVPDELIERHYDALTCLDPNGFRYYLPAYMIWSLKHCVTSDSLSSDYTIYSLCPSDDPEIRTAKLDRYRSFDEQQARVICRFLSFMANQRANYVDKTHARRALEEYWGKFCGDAS